MPTFELYLCHFPRFLKDLHCFRYFDRDVEGIYKFFRKRFLLNLFEWSFTIQANYELLHCHKKYLIQCPFAFANLLNLNTKSVL